MVAFGKGQPPNLRDPFGSELIREVRPNCIIWRSRESGQLHRPGGLPAIEWRNGTKEWYEHGERHRADGPAHLLSDGGAEWWQNGSKHRADGPAVISSTGREEWWLHGVQLDEMAIARLKRELAMRAPTPEPRRMPAPRHARRFRL